MRFANLPSVLADRFPRLKTPVILGFFAAVTALSACDYEANHQRAAGIVETNIPQLLFDSINKLDTKPIPYDREGGQVLGTMGRALEMREKLIQEEMWEQMGHRRTIDRVGRYVGEFGFFGFLFYKFLRSRNPRKIL